MRLEHRPFVLLVAWFVGLTLSGDAVADRAPFELTPFAAYRMGGEFQSGSDTAASDVRDGNGFGLGAGWYRDQESYYELLYSRRTAGLDDADPALGGVDVNIEYLHFGGTLLFPQSRGGSSWVSATVGLTRLGASSGNYSSERKFSGSIGGGYRIPLGTNLDVVLGLRAYLTLVDSDSQFVCTSIDGVGRCLIRVSSSSFWELEGLAGLSFRF
jgi:hypothetical protein